MKRNFYECECPSFFAHRVSSENEAEELMEYRQTLSNVGFMVNKNCKRANYKKYKIIKETEHMALIEK